MPLPDISKDNHAQHTLPLTWVGMEKIALPLTYKSYPVECFADIHINLPKADAKGIHMSRLFLELQELKEIQHTKIQTILEKILKTHEDCHATQVHLKLTFNLPIQRNALITRNISGWKYYKVEMDIQLNKDQISFNSTIDIDYSSTCPCSAALSRQLITDQFQQDFIDHHQISLDQVAIWLQKNASVATPHSQRSIASITVSHQDIDFLAFINLIENTLQTATQTAVKRADEQAFAKRNGGNLMFVEDAARRIGNILIQNHYKTWHIKVTHQESLHSHNAVAYLDHATVT